MSEYSGGIDIAQPENEMEQQNSGLSIFACCHRRILQYVIVSIKIT